MKVVFPDFSIDWRQVRTNVMTLALVGFMGLSLKVVWDNATIRDDEQDERIELLSDIIEENHQMSVMPPEPKKGFFIRTWNWVTFKEFRQ